LDACFVVRDASGQQVAYVYFEDEPGPTLSREALGQACHGLVKGKAKAA
jgi:hypothetical protein